MYVGAVLYYTLTQEPRRRRIYIAEVYYIIYLWYTLYEFVMIILCRSGVELLCCVGSDLVCADACVRRVVCGG